MDLLDGLKKENDECRMPNDEFKNKNPPSLSVHPVGYSHQLLSNGMNHSSFIIERFHQEQCKKQGTTGMK